MAQSIVTTQNRLPWPRLNLQSITLTNQQFYQLCQDNPELRLELTAQGELLIMPPTGTSTGWRNSKLNQRLANWAEQEGTGLTFDSSTGFTLPNGARRSPDAAWLPYSRWQALTADQQDGFAPFCPDFVAELRSLNDRLEMLQEKMEEYMANGARLGWLLDTKNRRVYIYRPNQAIEQLDNPKTITGDPILAGFVFNLQEIW
jgi:Uma2 family endonuclease